MFEEFVPSISLSNKPDDVSVNVNGVGLAAAALEAVFL